jgi:hypothetical protein
VSSLTNSALQNVVQVFASHSSFAALRQDSTVVVWSQKGAGGFAICPPPLTIVTSAANPAKKKRPGRPSEKKAAAAEKKQRIKSGVKLTSPVTKSSIWARTWWQPPVSKSC